MTGKFEGWYGTEEVDHEEDITKDAMVIASGVVEISHLSGCYL